MMVEAPPSSTLIMAQAYLLLQVLIVSFDAPPEFCCIDEIREARAFWQCTETILRGLFLVLGLFDEEPFFRSALLKLLVAVSGTSRLAIGDRMPAHCSSLGKILLAALPPNDLDTLLATRPLLKRTGKTITDPAALKIELDQVRRDHWAKVEDEMDEGTISIAVPLRGAAGGLVAALNVASHRSRCDIAAMVTTMLPQLQIAAQEIEVIIRSYELRGPR